MADFVFPPGGEGVEVIAPNGVKYFWDVNNNRWGIRGTTSSLSQIVKISTVEPDGVEGDLWYKTGGIHKDLFIKYAGVWEQAAPGKLEYDELVDRIALLESTTEIINEYKCELSTSIGGMGPQPGGFKSSSSSPQYANSIRLNPKDLYGNPIPIIHEGDGFEMLHEENGHSHRFSIYAVQQSSDTDLTLKVKFLGGDTDSFKQNEHYLFRFHTPNTDMEVLAHLDRDQTFIGANTFEGDVIFTGNVTLPDGDGDGDGEGAVTADGDNTFTGENTFENSLILKGQGTADFDELHSKIVSMSPPGWTPQDNLFGIHIDIGHRNSYKNQFTVGGRDNRDVAVSIFDDGAGGVVRATSKLQSDNALFVSGESDFKDHVKIYGTEGEVQNTVTGGETYIVESADVSQSGAFVKWREVGCSSPQPGHVFTATNDGTDTLVGTDTVKPYSGDKNLSLSGDISCTGILMADAIEGHEVYVSGYSTLDGGILTSGNLWIHQGGQGANGAYNALVVNQNINKGAGQTGSIARFQQNGSDVVKINLDGHIDCTGNNIINVGGNGSTDFEAANKKYVDDATNGAMFKFGEQACSNSYRITVAGNTCITLNGNKLSLLHSHVPNENDDTVPNIGWVKNYVSGGSGPSFGYKFTYTNIKTNMGTGKFTSQNESGTFRMYISETTADGETWYNNADMALKAIDFESAGGPGPMYTIRDVNDTQKIMRQGFTKAIQYQGNQFVLTFDGASQINSGGMTIGGNYYITIGGLF